MTAVVSSSNGATQPRDNSAHNPQLESYGGLEKPVSDTAQPYNASMEAVKKMGQLDEEMTEEEIAEWAANPTAIVLFKLDCGTSTETNGAGDSWLDRAWGSVRETANSVFMKAEHATSPFMQGEWDEKIGTAVRSIAAGGIQINSPKQREFDTKLGAVLRTAGLMAAGGQSLVLHLPPDRRA